MLKRTDQQTLCSVFVSNVIFYDSLKTGTTWVEESERLPLIARAVADINERQNVCSATETSGLLF